jgi:hypothetical protein
MDKNQRFCPDCFELCTIGRPHTCKPKAVAKPAPSLAPVSHVTNPVSTVSHVTNSVVSNATDRYLKRLEADRKRTARWRAKNADRYLMYMRELMRKRRAEARAAIVACQ